MEQGMRVCRGEERWELEKEIVRAWGVIMAGPNITHFRCVYFLFCIASLPPSLLNRMYSSDNL